MRRIIIPSAVLLVLVAALLLSPFSGEGGCHGNCFGPPPTPTAPGATPGPEERCQIGTGADLLGLSELDSSQQRPLCLIELALSPGNDSSGSVVDPGEADTFYVREGAVDVAVDAGAVRVVPGPNDDPPDLEQLPDGTYQAMEGQTFTISAGGSFYLDEQPETVVLRYANNAEEDASLLISSAPPVVEAAATPSPDGSPEP